MPVSEETYRRVALEDNMHWELHEGCLRQKPVMTTEHNQVIRRLGWQLRDQLDRNEWEVFIDNGKVRTPTGSYYYPDVFVAPMSAVESLLAVPRTFEVYDDPLPFLAEVWSRPTGQQDVESKVPAYRQRCDQEVWRINPYDRTVTIWRLQRDGRYTEALFSQGTVQLFALADVTIDLDALFR
jgi:Uma2 family endonuclease